MPADRTSRAARRRWCGGIWFALLGGRGAGEERREGKQDKGSASRHCVSDCLHIVILRDADGNERHLISQASISFQPFGGSVQRATLTSVFLADHILGSVE